MQKCNLCPEWAQWSVRKAVPRIVHDPVFDDEGKVSGMKETTITEFQMVALLCNLHHREQKDMPENSGLRFDFIGAVPLQVNCS